MRPPASEFSRPLQIARVPPRGSVERVTADEKECRTLARRIDVPRIHSLSARFEVKPWRGGGLKVDGLVEVRLDRISVISLEEFTTEQSFDVLRYFLPEGSVLPDGDEHDVDHINNGFIDLGEVAAETISLELDPYPRKPGEAFSAHAAGDETADVIVDLKDKRK